QAALDVAAAIFESRTKLELQAFGNEQGVLVAPIYSISDLLKDPQLEARSFWEDVGGRTHPGPFARFSKTPVQYRRPAPALRAARLHPPD
ncbi:MAG TPA: CoA transferase, partial [Plasticicumulans sp.]|nr:CoA transferase [Plasticicumulans sp.]